MGEIVVVKVGSADSEGKGSKKKCLPLNWKKTWMEEEEEDRRGSGGGEEE